MTLRACRECDNEVSTEAASCPHCGAPDPTARPCSECGHLLDDPTAAECPKCETPDPAVELSSTAQAFNERFQDEARDGDTVWWKSWDRVGKGFLLFAGVVMAAMVIDTLGSNSGNSTSNSTLKSSSSSGESWGLYSEPQITCDGYPITTSQAHLDKLVDFAASGDKEAWVQYVRENPGVQMLEGGQKVYVEETEDLGSIIKIRPKGETIGVWTVREAIQQPCR